MKRIRIGNVYKIEMEIGLGFFQCVDIDKIEGELIKIFYKLYSSQPAIEDIVGDEDYYYSRFPLKYALKKNLVTYVGYVDLPRDFHLPRFTRTKHLIKGEFLGWFIVDTKTKQMVLVKKLSGEQEKLSPNGIINDTYLKDRWKEGWRLENWT